MYRYDFSLLSDLWAYCFFYLWYLWQKGGWLCPLVSDVLSIILFCPICCPQICVCCGDLFYHLALFVPSFRHLFVFIFGTCFLHLDGVLGVCWLFLTLFSSFLFYFSWFLPLQLFLFIFVRCFIFSSHPWSSSDLPCCIYFLSESSTCNFSKLVILSCFSSLLPLLSF